MMAKSKCCVCYNSEYDTLIYQSKVTLEKLSNEVVKSKLYGYSCDKKAEKKIDLLHNYLLVMEDENRKLTLGAKECLDCYNKQSLAEKVRKLTVSCDTSKRRDLVVDDSMEDAWIAQNPYCVSRERWEKLAYTVCGIFDIEIIAEEYLCNYDFEVISTEKACDLTFELSRKIIPCDIMIAISVHREMCDLRFDITRTEEECKLDFDILASEIKCDLDFKTYQKLIECNLSFDVIKTIYENNCTIEIGDPVPELFLATQLNKYPIASLSSKIPDINELKKLGLDLSNSEYVKNPDKFIQKLKQDYK